MQPRTGNVLILQGKWKFFQQKTFIRIPGFRPHPLSPLRPAWCLLLGRSSCNLRRISSIATKPSLRDSMFRWSKVYAYTILDSLSEIWNQICAKHLFGRGRMKSQWYLARYDFNRPNYHVWTIMKKTNLLLEDWICPFSGPFVGKMDEQ